MRWFVDTSIFLFAVGEDHPRRHDCEAFLRRARDNRDALHASIEAAQEFSFHRLRRVQRDQALADTDAFISSVVLHPFDLEVLTRARTLLGTTSLRGRDAVHAATAQLAGFDRIVSTDGDFDSVPGLRRVDPTDA